jgi:kanamycin kinase
VTVPAAVAAAAGGQALRLVWANEAGGLTFAAGEGAGQRFIKWAPAGSGIDLTAEAERMAWARRYHPVPEPLACGHDDTGSWLVTAALEQAAAIPPTDKLVVCHGDACAPNTLLASGGRWSGHVDLGLLGAGDRWADLAVATWSTEWNYGPGWDQPLLDAYGIAADPERTRYYRLLWDLSS